MSARIGLLALLLSASAAVPAAAQPSAGSWEVSGGGLFTGGFDLGERTAELTSNSGTTGGTFDFFRTDGRVRPVTGVLARLGLFLTPSFAVEGGVRFTRPVFAVRITGDAEDAPDITAEETLTEYLFDGSAVWHFGRSASRGGRATPFVYAGAGYLRELHEGEALVEEGLEYHAGGGLKWWLGARRKIGIRAEAGISIRDGGFELEEKRRLVPVAGGSLIWVF